MTKTAARKKASPKRNYSQAEIDAALAIYALESGREPTVCAALEQSGLGHVPFETLRSWAYKRHKERYQQISSEVETHRRSQLADQHMRLAHQNAELVEETARLLRERLENPDELDVKDLAKILREAANATGMHTKNQQLLSGRPTAIIENRAEDIRRILAERHGIVVRFKGEEGAERPQLPAAS